MAQADGNQGVVCQKCRMLLHTEFELVDGLPACDTCAPALKSELRRRQSASLRLPGGWWTRAILFAGGAALTGAVIYAAVLLATGFEPSILALGIGAAVGIAAREGAGNKGGMPLQLISVGLVYAGMVLAYVIVASLASWAGNLAGLTAEIAEFREQLGDGPGALAFALSRPFLSGVVGLISLVLGFFAAWRFCAEGQAGDANLSVWRRLANTPRD